MRVYQNEMNRNKRGAYCLLNAALFVFAGLLLVALPANAETVKEILQKVDKAVYTKTMRMDLVQVVTTPSGESRKFKMTSYSKNGTEQSLTEYTDPPRVNGMKILTLNDGDEIWTYFPKINRTRIIASSARNRRVQGSDFTYDDMALGKFEKNWTGKLGTEEKIAGKMCYKLIVKPTKTGPRSYSKAIMWVNKTNYTVVQTDYYDEDGEHSKQLQVGKYKKMGDVYVPFYYKMTNLLDGGKTEMKVSKAYINTNIDPNLFRKASLGS